MDNRANRMGKAYYIDGTIRYDGEWKNGAYNGMGKEYHYIDGTLRYDGEWKDGVYNGMGMFYIDGTLKYDGIPRSLQKYSYMCENGP